MGMILETIHELWRAVHSGGWPELGSWSYLLLLLLVATEGPVSTLLGAAAAATGVLDLRYVFIASFAGNVLGDCLWYSVGYVNKLQRIHRFSRWIGIHSHHLDRLEVEMHTHATKLIAISKLAIGLIIPTLIAAGLARVPWRRWFPLVLTVETAWTILMVNLGFHGAGLVTHLESGLQALGMIFLVGLLIIGFWYVRRHSRGDKVTITAEPDLLQSRQRMRHLQFLHHSITSNRPVYKQLSYRFSDGRQRNRTMLLLSLSAKSTMTKALAEALAVRKIVDALVIPKRHTHVQGQFAGD